MRGADVLAMPRFAHVAAENGQPPVLHLARARDERQQAGLSHPIGPDQADHAARRDVERKIVERLRRPVSQAKVLAMRDGGRELGRHCTTFEAR